MNGNPLQKATGQKYIRTIFFAQCWYHEWRLWIEISDGLLGSQGKVGGGVRLLDLPGHVRAMALTLLPEI